MGYPWIGKVVFNTLANDYQFLGLAVDRDRAANAVAAMATKIEINELALPLHELFSQGAIKNGLG